MLREWLRRFRKAGAGVPQSLQEPRQTGFADLFGQPAAAAGEPDRQTVLIIGNCIAEGLQQGLASVQAGTRWRFVAMPLHLRAMGDPSSLQEIAAAGHLFVQQLGAVDWSQLHSVKKPEAREAQFPDFVFRSPWPFDGEGGFGDPAVALKPGARIRHEDGTLGRLRAMEPDKKKRIQKYADLDFGWATMIDRTIETQIRFLAAMDEGSPVKLGKFILDRYRDGPLFYTSTHPSAAVFGHLCEYAWTELGLPEPFPAFGGMDGWRDWSVPVHPRIASRMGMGWADQSNSLPLCHVG